MLYDPPIEEINHAIRVISVPRIVGYHADRRSALMKLAEEIHHRFAVLGIEIAGRFVGEQNRRIASDSPRYRHALLLTAR